jgi:uncharacterized protein (DUF3820 family)
MTDHRLCIWPFGKFKDKEIDLLENSYLRWILTQEWFLRDYPNFSNVVLEELKWRKEQGVVIEDDS